MAAYFSSTLNPRIAARSLPIMIGVQDAPCGGDLVPRVIGTARGIGSHGHADEARAEQVWGLAVGKQELEGGYLLRDGVFVELGEAAEWTRWGEGSWREEEERLRRVFRASIRD